MDVKNSPAGHVTEKCAIRQMSFTTPTGTDSTPAFAPFTYRCAHKGVELWDYFTPTKDNFYSFIFVLPSHLNKY